MCLGLSNSAFSASLNSESLPAAFASEARFGEDVVSHGLSEAPVGDSHGIRCARIASGDGWNVVCDDSHYINSMQRYEGHSLAIDVTSRSISRSVTR